MAGKDLSTCGIICHLPGYISTKLDQKWAARTWTSTPVWDTDVSSTGLTCGATILAHGTVFHSESFFFFNFLLTRPSAVRMNSPRRMDFSLTLLNRCYFPYSEFMLTNSPYALFGCLFFFSNQFYHLTKGSQFELTRDYSPSLIFPSSLSLIQQSWVTVSRTLAENKNPSSIHKVI